MAGARTHSIFTNTFGIYAPVVKRLSRLVYTELVPVQVWAGVRRGSLVRSNTGLIILTTLVQIQPPQLIRVEEIRLSYNGKYRTCDRGDSMPHSNTFADVLTALRSRQYPNTYLPSRRLTIIYHWFDSSTATSRRAHARCWRAILVVTYIRYIVWHAGPSEATLATFK